MLAVPKRGRKYGEKPHLTVEQLTLGDRQAVRQLIKLQFGL